MSQLRTHAGWLPGLPSAAAGSPGAGSPTAARPRARAASAAPPWAVGLWARGAGLGSVLTRCWLPALLGAGARPHFLFRPRPEARETPRGRAAAAVPGFRERDGTATACGPLAVGAPRGRESGRGCPCVGLWALGPRDWA